jgi:hypothetical protein
MSLTLSKILADPNRDLIARMSDGTLIMRAREQPSALPNHASKPGEAQSPVGEEGAAGSRANRAGLTSEASLSSGEKEALEELQRRDREVRLHEQKHMAAAGTLAKGKPVYEYAIGPDGKPYAIGGHVRIDTGAVAGDPEATRARARQVQRAAMAPGTPSGQDMAVATGDANSLFSQASIETNQSSHSNPVDTGPEAREYRWNAARSSNEDGGGYGLRLYA